MNPDRNLDALIEKHVFGRIPCDGWTLEIKDYVKTPDGQWHCLNYDDIEVNSPHQTAPVFFRVPVLTRTCSIADHHDNDSCYSKKEYDFPGRQILGGPRRFTESADDDLLVLARICKLPDEKFLEPCRILTDEWAIRNRNTRHSPFLYCNYQPGDYGRAALRALGIEPEETE